jgi:hypothetical protein
LLSPHAAMNLASSSLGMKSDIWWPRCPSSLYTATTCRAVCTAGCSIKLTSCSDPMTSAGGGPAARHPCTQPRPAKKENLIAVLASNNLLYARIASACGGRAGHHPHLYIATACNVACAVALVCWCLTTMTSTMVSWGTVEVTCQAREVQYKRGVT